MYRLYGPWGSTGIALIFHDHSIRRGWGVSVTHRPLFTPGKDPVPIVQEAGWAPGPVWTGAENLDPTGIWSPDRPTRSQSLHRLSYPAHNLHIVMQYLLNVRTCMTKRIVRHTYLALLCVFSSRYKHRTYKSRTTLVPQKSRHNTFVNNTRTSKNK